MTDAIDPTWVSVDVETSGPYPGRYALLSLGACLVGDPEREFYVELVPDHDDVDPTSMAVHGLTLDRLRESGVPAREGMSKFAEWLDEQVQGPARMVGFNAPFDWMFVQHYFWTYLGTNPLGHSAIDIKAFAMGRLQIPWEETSFPSLAARFEMPLTLSHNALDDAQRQGRLMSAIAKAHTP